VRVKKMGSPKVALAALLVAVAIAAGTSAGASSGGSSGPGLAIPSLSACVKAVPAEVIAKDKLTVATDSPALEPWFIDDMPSNGMGYESAVAYGVASMLGFKASDVTWYSEPYWESETAGTKPFDFDINELVATTKLSSKVSFSSSYFNVNQSLVTMKGDRVITHHSPSALKDYLYGDVKGSPGLTFIKDQIHPRSPPVVYATLALALVALEAKQIQAIVVDTPSGQYIASQQLTDGVQVAQFHTTTEHYALLLQKSSPLTVCVDVALRAMSKKGELTTLSKKYLSIYNSIPVIQP
jgi:polar amino acid transport system substrate-binding protein